MWTNCHQTSELLWNWVTLRLLGQTYFTNFSLLSKFLQVFAAPQRMDSFSHAPTANALIKGEPITGKVSFISMKVEAYPDRPLPVGPCRWKCLKEQICSFALPTHSRLWILWDITAEQTLSGGLTALILIRTSSDCSLVVILLYWKSRSFVLYLIVFVMTWYTFILLPNI